MRQAAELVEQRRLESAPRLSVREAARRAGISDGWWRQVVNGGRYHGETWIAANPTVECLLDMGFAVGAEEEVAEVLGVDPRTRNPRDVLAGLRGVTPEVRDRLLSYYDGITQR